MIAAQNDFQVIKKILLTESRGLSFSHIRDRLGYKINEKTLLRRLNKLIQQGDVEKIGKTRGVTYKLATIIDQESPKLDTELKTLSAESRDLLIVMNQSETSRNPVGYNRKYLESYHPNISSYLSGAEKENLMRLGETARQNEPAGTYAKDILQRLLIDLSWNSSRLEGNSYSLLDTQRLISIGEVAEDKSASDAQMILNHKDAIEFIVANSEEIGFNRYTILNIHALLSNNLLSDPTASGRLRSFGVGIQRSVFTPLGVPQVIEELFDKVLEKANQINDPFEQSFFIMVHLPYLQPFEDVNKRVSRVAANISLNKRNLVPISFVDVPDSLYKKGTLAVYELNRIDLLKDVFLWAYERSSARYSALRQSLGEPDPMRLKYRREIRRLINEIVSNELSYKDTLKLINRDAYDINEIDRNKFKESVETELMSLHYGNIARYNLRLSNFEEWQKIWQH